MRRVPESPLARSDVLADRAWYHQRFDGSPMFIFAIADAERRVERRKPQAAYPSVRVAVFERGKADWYLELDDLRRSAAALVATARRDPARFTRYRQAWRADERAYEAFVWDELPRIALARLGERELWTLWQRAYRLVLRRLSFSGIVDHFALGTDALVHAMVTQEVRRHPKDGGWTAAELAQVFSAVTAPVHHSYTNRAEIDLLAIAAGRAAETVEQYQARYFWLSNNFLSATVLPVRHFADELAARRASGADLAAQLEALEGAPARNRREKEALIERFGFSPLLRALLAISEDFTAWQDERKRATLLNIHAGTRLLQEIGRRTGYALDELQHTTGFELEGVLFGGTPSREELRARREHAVFVALPEGFYVATGSEAEQVRALVERGAQPAGAASASATDAFGGLTASLGKAVGRVKIVGSARELSRVEPGDVLVAVMTRPDYVAAMKRAAAIVTNEGGITSHAAIVSRELRIPCVIGTRIATRVLHDGDLVEVDADQGTVTVLERAAGAACSPAASS